MYVALREAIEQLEEPTVPADLVEAFTLLDQLTAHLTQSVGRLEREGAFETETLTSPTSWLAYFAKRTGGQASALTKAARKIIQLPVTGRAWRDGTLSGGHIDAILANVKTRHVALFAEAEGEMVPKLAPLSVHDAAIVMRWWAALADDALPDDDKEDPPESLHVSATLDGRHVLKGHVSADTGAIIEQALRLAGVDDPNVPLSERNAVALKDIAEFFLNHHDKKGARRNRPHLTVVLRGDDEEDPIGETLGGVPLSRAGLRKIFCDCTVSRLVTSRGEILDYGVPTPTIPVHLWQAVAVRDRGCRFPGCTRPVSWCECHHVHWRDHGGPTAVDNLALFCSHHHHVLHSPGWSAKLLADGQLEITAPDGSVRTSYPPDQRRTLWPPGGDPPG